MVLVVVYGNRAYDDAFAELKDLAVDCGFVACVKNWPTAAIAFQELAQKLSRECQARQEPEIYLPMA